MTQRFKLVNKSRINNNRIRLIKTQTTTSELDPLFGAVYESDSEIGICLAPNTVISCVGAKVETDEILIDGDGWAVEVDGQIINIPTTRTLNGSVTPVNSYDQMVQLLEANGVRVTELVGQYKMPIVCDGAISKEEVSIEDGGWLLEVDGVDMGGPYDLASLDALSRRREVRITIPQTLTCDINSSKQFTYHGLILPELDGIYDVMSGELLLAGSDIVEFGDTSTEKLLLNTDNYYQVGTLTNATEECLIVEYRPKPGGSLNAGMYHYMDQSECTVTEVDGRYQIHLGPNKFEKPDMFIYSIHIEEGAGNYRKLMNEAVVGDQVNSIYLGVHAVSMNMTRPTGYDIEFRGQRATVPRDGSLIYFKVDNIPTNTGFTTAHYRFIDDLYSPDEILIVADSGAGTDLMVDTTRYGQMVAPFSIPAVTGSLSVTYTNDTTWSQMAFSPRQVISRGATLKITCPTEFIGAGVHVDIEGVQTTTVGADGTATITFPTEFSGSQRFADIILVNPNPIDQRETAHLYDHRFCELDGFIFE